LPVRYKRRRYSPFGLPPPPLPRPQAIASAATVNCPRCQQGFFIDISTSPYILQREAEFRVREAQLQEREKMLRLREIERVDEVRLIKSCLHPDKHPDQAERYTKAWQAFERPLASTGKL
jgi:hypothetical protein